MAMSQQSVILDLATRWARPAQDDKQPANETGIRSVAKYSSFPGPTVPDGLGQLKIIKAALPHASLSPLVAKHSRRFCRYRGLCGAAFKSVHDRIRIGLGSVDFC